MVPYGAEFDADEDTNEHKKQQHTAVHSVAVVRVRRDVDRPEQRQGWRCHVLLSQTAHDATIVYYYLTTASIPYIICILYRSTSFAAMGCPFCSTRSHPVISTCQLTYVAPAPAAPAWWRFANSAERLGQVLEVNVA